MESSRWSRWITIAAVLLLAVIAAVVSYSHMFELALRHGEPQWRAALFPLSVDGMIVAASMTLLSDARQGRRGGLLPWSLLVLGSVASLCANVAVAEPTLWSQTIHAWPSLALIGAYELLMRHFRANAAGVRQEYAGRTPTPEEATEAKEMASAAGLEKVSQAPERRHLHVVQTHGPAGDSVVAESVNGDALPPRMQQEAWKWALANRREDGSLPSGQEIATQFDRKERWGRLIKQWGQQGRFDRVAG